MNKPTTRPRRRRLTTDMVAHGIFLALVCLIAPPVYATTYWVGKSGSGNCASADGPTDPGAANRILTIASGISCLNAGDTLIIGDGIYAEEVFGTIPSGSVGAPTILQAENRNQVIIGKTVSSGAIIGGITISGQDYITLDGLYVDTQDSGIPYYCGVVSCSFITIKNGTATRGGGSHSNSGIQGVFADTLIQNMDVIDNGDSFPGGSFLSMGNHGMYLVGSNNVIEGNRVVCNPDAGGGIDHRGAFNGSGTVIRNNIVSGCALYGINLHSFTDGLAYNNLVFDGSNTSSEGIPSYVIAVASSFAVNVGVYNNTGFNTTGGIIVQTGGAGTPDDVELINNLLYQTSTGIQVTAGTNISCTTNLNVGGNGVNNGCSATLGTTDPRFAASGSADFRLCTAVNTPVMGCAGASGAIDLGTTIDEVPTDIIGITRPQGLAFDIGGYESFAGAGDPTRVSFATDNFTNTTTQLVSAYSANWAIVWENGTSNGVFVDAMTDVAYGNPAPAGSPWVARRADVATGWLNDQYASCQVVAVPPTTPTYTSLVGVVVRASTDTNGNRDYLLAEMYGYEGARCVSLQQFVNGTKSSLGDDCATTWTTSDFLEIDVIGTVVRVLKNETPIITASTTLTTGFPGIAGAGNVGSIEAALDNCDFGSFDDPQPPAGDIVLSLPATGATYRRPDPSVRIEWTTQNITGNVELEYSLNGGAFYYPIATVGYNTSPYFWTANVPATTHLVVRVRQGASSDASGELTLRGRYLR